MLGGGRASPEGRPELPGGPRTADRRRPTDDPTERQPTASPPWPATPWRRRPPSNPGQCPTVEADLITLRSTRRATDIDDRSGTGIAATSSRVSLARAIWLSLARTQA